ncbi:DUF4012 domain-containing protein [Georgenia sp. EYE_87]|uniref:DUF4012 domain-containing protein n=1 Tax=Georgenia sp. EYE_87 TaxID=2853448 RepID=UPI002003777A|nr:DUF4012 domain-containing protein [Georgenia sp. EYE_87]MCK6210805.1 DUF4012 domain-containing protein [Georgenia sp. EYE_87]
MWTAVALLALTVVTGVALALDARTAYARLTAVAEGTRVLQERVVAGDVDGAGETATRMRADAAAAREALHGPHWWLAGRVPGLGPNVEAVQTVSVVADELASGPLEDLLGVVAVVDPASLAPVEGRVDVAPLAGAAPRLESAAQALAAADSRVKGIDAAALAEPLREPLARLAREVDTMRALSDTAARAARLVPAMMGSDGPRDYLLLVQNNAEPRATGGIPGAVVHLRAAGGAVELVGQRPASDFGPYEEPVLPLTDPELGLYSPLLGQYMQDVTFTPDFPRIAELAREMWRVETGTEVDGVLSVDPVALQRLLAVTGPVTLPGGEQLTADNTAKVLLSDVYARFPEPADQDAFFETAAATIFEQVVGGDVDPKATIEALDAAADKGRLLVWSAHEDEQRLLAGTKLGGELRGNTGTSPVLGVYLNDRNGAKIGYYQRVAAEVVTTDCGPDGARQLTLEVAVGSDVPDDVASLPDYVTGGGNYVPEGAMETTVTVYAPTGGAITDARSSADDASYLPQVHEDLAVGAHTVRVGPGESVTLGYDITLASGLPGELLTRMTPGPAEDAFTITSTGCGT